MIKTSFALSDENRGLLIATETYNTYSNFKDSSANLEMIIVSKQGETVTRKLWMKTLQDNDHKSDKTLLVFVLPQDIRGTSLLTWRFN